MGLSCSTDLRERLGFSEKVKEQNKCNNLCNDDEEEEVEVALTFPSFRYVPENRPQLSAECQVTVQQTWDIIKRDIERVGVVMFMGLLEDPEIRGSFRSFRDKTMEELKASAVLRSHVLRVMGAVEKVVARLDNEEKLVTLLHELGQRHLVYSVRPEFLDLIGPEYNNAIKPPLGDKWTPEVEQAWDDLFRYITHVMRETMVM
ncbi:unnamed protein product [Candidula unifasciata]|uniref:Globin n=1 Tax=Candidula unifasciata TaxID=100452 RepID=A0A8S3ZS44_9EUPU|nr:unnamed protein product [Candidula unifasciata]